MTKDLIVSANRHETKVAILEDEQLVEIYFQRSNEYSLVGSIHKGRVTRVLPGMQSAFVDIGLERDAFLYVSDFFEESDEYEPMSGVEEKGPGPRKDRGAPPRKERPPAPQRVAVQEAPPPPPPPPAAAPVAVGPPPREDADAEGRDRRGRRSRRRRNRGRGFPDSKYAADVPAQGQAPSPVAERPLPSSIGPAEADDFILLPGESVAKYRHAPEALTADTVKEEAIPVAESISIAPSDELDDEPDSSDGEEFEPVEDVVGALPFQEESERSRDDEPRVSSAWEDESEEPEQATAAIEPEAAGAVITWLEPDIILESHDAIEEPDVEFPEVEEERDIQDVVLEQLSREESAESDAPLRQAGSPDEAAEPERPAAAQVREREPRYLHRLSRRNRRRGERQEPETREPAAAEVRPAAAEAPQKSERSVPVRERPPLPSIADLLKEGQEIIVQIAKEPLGQKGARITSHVALPGRYVVFMPTLDHLGVSRKIASDEERHRLRRILQTHREGIPGGFIVRTAGEGKPEAEIASDMNFLYNLWLDIRKKAEKKPSPCLLHHDLEVVERVLRDQLTGEFKSIWVDHEDTYESVLQFLQRFQPALINRVKMYTREAPVFDAFSISSELEKALRPKVWLKSGGYIVINQTEALVAIDINTGKFVGKSNRLEDTIVKTNTEAVKEIARQMRLRDLGGIIVVDFIDMDERKNRQKVMQALEEAMRNDRAPYKVLAFNDFGLVAITRKRVKQSLERTLCASCPYCEGAGYVKSVETIIGEILVESHKIARAVEKDSVILRVHPDVAKQLKASRSDYIAELEEVLGRPVMVTADPLLQHEKFDWA